MPDIGLPFTPGMSALIQSRLTPQTAHEAMVTAPAELADALLALAGRVPALAAETEA